MSGYEIQGLRRGDWISVGTCGGRPAANTLADRIRRAGRFEDVRVQPPDGAAKLPRDKRRRPPRNPRR